jgi:hypothetical protein
LSATEARTHFDWFFGFASIGQPASSDQTRARLGWHPTGPDLVTDILEAGYFAEEPS